MHWEDLEGVGREGGGRGDRDGEPMAVSFQCMTKFTTKKKRIQKKKRILFSIYLKIELLDHMVILCLIYQRTATKIATAVHRLMLHSH